jgi:hypothetical protein
MADMFTTLISIVPKPATTTTPGTQPALTGVFNTNVSRPVQTPGGK